MPERPRNPCPSGEHHAHPGLTCDEYDAWREQIRAAISEPKRQEQR